MQELEIEQDRDRLEKHEEKKSEKSEKTDEIKEINANVMQIRSNQK